jgi:hypothetical protein
VDGGLKLQINMAPGSGIEHCNYCMAMQKARVTF